MLIKFTDKDNAIANIISDIEKISDNCKHGRSKIFCCKCRYGRSPKYEEPPILDVVDYIEKNEL